jgi:hypothetical protein
VIVRHTRRGRNQRCVQAGRGEWAVASNVGRRRNHGVHADAVARVVADHVGTGSDDGGGEIRRRSLRAQAFGGRWSGVRLDGEQVRDGIAGRGQLQIGCVHDFGDERSAPCNLDGLRVVKGFLASGGAGRSRLGSAEILHARQFVTAEIDDVMAGDCRDCVGPKLRDLCLKKDDSENDDGLDHVRRDHDPEGDQSEGSFSGEASFGAREGGADRFEEVAPARRPVDEQGRSIVRVGSSTGDGLFELKSLGHQECWWLSLERVISIVSPISVFVCTTVWHGSSSTELAWRRIGAKRQGLTFC